MPVIARPFSDSLPQALGVDASFSTSGALTAIGAYSATIASNLLSYAGVSATGGKGTAGLVLGVWVGTPRLRFAGPFRPLGSRSLLPP